MYKYSVYDDDKLVLESDDCESIGRALNKSKATITYALRNETLVAKKYRIIQNEGFEQEFKDGRLNYLIRHLREYGNTCINENPEKYMDKLKEAGINATYRKVKSVIKHGRPFYILEDDDRLREVKGIK